MKNFLLNCALVLMLAIGMLSLLCWTANVVKLVCCDWSDTGSWKGEIIHGIGIIGPAAIVTVWFDDK